MDADATLSLFTLLTQNLGPPLVPIQATKATLVDVSHALEDLVLTERLPAMIFTGFQESSHWREETARYRELAGVAHQICIFAGGELPPEDDQRHIHVRLRGPDPLRQEWFLLVLTGRFAAVLCGRDLLAPALSESDRRFATLWSFEPAIVSSILTLLREVVARERPDRLIDLEDSTRRFPPPPPDARLMTRFTTQLIDSLTHQHQARLHLERVLAYESRLRALGQVLSGVAHELNNPLQGILGFASLIAEDPALGLEVVGDARHIIEAAQRAQSIVQTLLQLARPSSDQRGVTDLALLVERTLIFVRSDVETYGIQLTFEATPGIKAIAANAVRLQQLLINLLTNAIQALANHPPPRLIQIRVTAPTPDSVELVIRDNGSGIPSHLHEQVFEPFFTTKPVGEGTGLGLSIVRTIVEEHAGTITLESKGVGGTAFYIRFPAVNLTPPEADVDSATPAPGRILVIDDDPQVNALIVRVLERAGYSVHAEQNPETALDRLSRESFDAVICDLLMPGLNGMELYEKLIARNPALVQRLIFITGDATRPTTHAFLEGSGRPYVLKPFTPKQLLEVLGQVLPGQ